MEILRAILSAFVLSFLMNDAVRNVDCAKILVLHPLHSGSHKLQLEILSNHLVQRGHQVTTISFINVGDTPSTKTTSNVTNYVLSVDNSDGRYPYMTVGREGRFRFPITLLWHRGHNPHNLPLDTFTMTEALCRGLFESQLLSTVKNLTFDLAIIDLITNECGLSFLYQAGIPVVAYWAIFPVNGEMDYIGSFTPPSYVPNFLSKISESSLLTSFPDRLYNTYLRLGGYLVMQYQFYLSQKYTQEYFPGTPSSKTLISNMSGILINSDFALDYAKTLPPNSVNVGCMQCRDPQPLPKDLQGFMDSSKDAGVVVFSMGASFDAAVAKSLLPKLFDAFSRLQQKVLMKISPVHAFVNVTPPNVKLVRWYPQQDVLGNPKTKAFFTHCGLHGVFEAIYHGVPMIAMPVFGDQFDVLTRLEERGVAVGLQKDASAQEIFEALTAVLNNVEYRENSEKLRRLLKDQQEHPLQRATWLIEYVMRTNGAPHLKLGSRHLSWWQLYCFDVTLTFIIMGLFLMWTVYKLLVTIATLLMKKLVHFSETVQHFVAQGFAKSKAHLDQNSTSFLRKSIKTD